MIDEVVTKLAKKRGRPTKYSEDQAKLAHELYVKQNLTGEAVSRAMGIPRTSVLDLAAEHAARIEAGAPDKAPGQEGPQSEAPVQSTRPSQQTPRTKRTA